MKRASLLAIIFATAFSSLRAGQPLDAGLMRMPAVSEKQIAFVYAGDIWIAPKEGGTAIQLSTPRGEELFPRFSPDGNEIAFTGDYDGNEDIYVMPVTGGAPRRVTFHSTSDRMVCWWPNGKSILFESRRESFTDRVGQFFKINAQGGLPERLPIPYGEFAAVSPDGKTIAYTLTNTDGATWKRYRGGMAPDIWLFHLDTGAAENITQNPANDSQPMWASNGRLYFLSDRDGAKRANLWRYDLATKTTKQITHYADFDVRYPSIGPKEIVFENGGHLFLLDLATEQAREVSIQVITDKATLRPRVENVGGLITHATISPTGKRVLFEARGDIFSVPAEHGIIRNFTESQGIAERFPAWSPDGKWIAYFSDRSGEYELTLRPADGKGGEEQITHLGAGFRYTPQWSPDSRKLVFIDSAMRIWLHDLDTKSTMQIDRQMWFFQDELEWFRVSWSADSRWLAYACDTENRQQAIVIYDVKNGRRNQVTSAFYDDDLPVFDPAGKFLYYRSKRNFNPVHSDFDNTWTYTNSHALVCVPLLKATPSPLAPRDDEEPVKKAIAPIKKEEKKDDQKKSNEPEKRGDDSKKAETDPQTALKRAEQPADQKPAQQPADEKQIAAPPKFREVKIDLDDFESRGVVLPVGSGRIDNICAVPGKVIFRWPPRAGSNSKGAPVSAYDLDARAEKKILDDAGAIELSADGKKLLVARGGDWLIASVSSAPPGTPGASGEKILPTKSLEMTVDPVAEWHQIFSDAWRIERDFFYDPHLHGVDWKAMRERYGKMIDGCATRYDVNYVIGEMLGELNSSHTYRGGGDLEAGPKRAVGYLGCDFSLEDGAFRIKHILEAAPWDAARSPLRAPGVNVRGGDFLLAVDGRKIDTTQEPSAAFQGLAEKTVMLTLNDKPSPEGARDVLVQTLASETDLRHRAWIEQNRRRVDDATHGHVGYIYVKNTGDDGQLELYRQWRGQTQKDALIIDERWNSGGHTPDRFIELLNRPVMSFWKVRDGHDWTTPFVTQSGPKVMLANSWSGSGGDNFPWLFQQNKLGPLIGTRTWGGLIGITGCPPLVDGGHVTVPTFGIYSTAGKWIIEGEGVHPDIEVIDDPAQLAKGVDPQLERAIKETLAELEKNPLKKTTPPDYTDRTR